ncbi:MAG: DEAD/DEAH box helicase [Pseudomonadales bacterium]|nr:DEAD/DEAH box helicase [Pseudomonadales bacterium]
MSDNNIAVTTFKDLGLPEAMLSTITDIGYETPSPIQAQTIPHLLKGLDLLGHAPTGTGKTAAFALPLLSRLDTKSKNVQIMVLAPTRELAIQVAEAFQRYASHIRNFHVLPIYGGQEYAGQLRGLKRGAQVVVGTPGRIMDHMRRGTLKLGNLSALVLDEADEMLRMGFIDDVEWILEQIPERRQMALFSATMPKQVRKISKRYLKDPQEITIKSRAATADTIRQRYWLVSRIHKLDALTRILEVEKFDALLMFVRTKMATVELAERLEARGFSAAALNGDMQQKHREKMIERLKKGSLDILVATDVAARGLDVERISHVINFDIPYDTEAYIHRIGRTGRAGRKGDAILFVAPRERHLLKAIEKATRQKITQLELPSTEMVNNKRIADFKQTISDTRSAGELEFMQGLLAQYQQEHDVPAIEIAAALAKMAFDEKPFLLEPDKEKTRRDKPKSDKFRSDDKPKRSRRKDNNAFSSGSDSSFGKKKHTEKAPRVRSAPPKGMHRFRIEVGHDHEVQPGNIVGCIANEAGLDAEHIGQIDIHQEYSFVDLPAGMPREIFKDLKKAWVCGQRLQISQSDPSKRNKSDDKKIRKPSKKKI